MGTGVLGPPPPEQAPTGLLSRVAREGAVGVQAGEAAEGPDGEDIPVARVADGTGLVEDARDIFLKGHRTLNTKAARWPRGGAGWRAVRRLSPLRQLAALTLQQAHQPGRQLCTAVSASLIRGGGLASRDLATPCPRDKQSGRRPPSTTSPLPQFQQQGPRPPTADLLSTGHSLVGV